MPIIYGPTAQYQPPVYEPLKPGSRVLVGCEFSGIVRDAFIRRGHDAVSCDLLESERPGPHIIGDVRDVIGDGWDLMIVHPPCTHLSVSGNRWWAGTRERVEALGLVRELLGADVERICLENPVGVISTEVRGASQYLQPWEYGHGENKRTGLWLKGLPLLRATKIVEGRENRVHRAAPGKNRWMERSRTFEGIAVAMAEQWG